jgi:diguanylate cyclase (GGDEF)-like protein/PAS domain S-box-containing protein
MSKPTIDNLTSLIESTDDLIWSVDLDFRVTAFNHAFASRIRIYNREAEVGKAQEELLPPERVRFWLPLYARALAEGPFQMEHSSSGDRTVELRFHPIVDRGRKTGVAVFGRDITQHKTTERALAEAERRFRDLYEGALEGVYRTTPRGKPLAINPAGARILGYDSPQDFLLRVTNALEDLWVESADRDVYKERLRAHNSIHGMEARFKSKTGAVVWVSLEGRRIAAAEGNEECYEGFFKDITARKEAEKAASFLASVVESSEDAIFTYSLSGSIQTWNRGAERMYGYRPEEIIHQPVTMLVDPERREFIPEYIAELIRGHAPVHLRATALKKGGQRIDISVTSCPIYDFSGAAIAVSAIARDESAVREAERQLQESEARYRATFDQAAVGIAHIDFEGRYLRCNERYTEIVGYSMEELRRLTVQAIAAPEEIAGTLVRLEHLKSDPGHASQLEKRFVRKDGSVAWIRVTNSVQHDAAGLPLHIIGVVEDISAQKAAETQAVAALEAMRASEKRYRTAFETSIDAICITRIADGHIMDANQAFIDLFGWSREELIGRTGIDRGFWLCAEDRNAWVATIRRDSECRNLRVQLRKKNAATFWAEISASEIELDGHRCALTLVRDVSTVLQAEEKIRNLAFYDPLTNLPNRRLLEDRFHQLSARAMRHGSKIGLVYIDLDEFKPINDQLGHAVGDLALCAVATRLKESLRAADTASRIGGDEFVALLADLDDREDALRAVEKIRSAMARPFTTHQGRLLTASASIGVAIYPDDGVDMRTLLLHGDEAMYLEKKNRAGKATSY